MIKSEIKTSAGFFLVAILFGTTSFGNLAFVLAIAVSFVAQFRSYGKIFGTSVYGEEADVYMVLPLTPDILILSKVMVGIVWNMLLSLAIMAYILIIVLWGSGIEGLTTGLLGILAMNFAELGLTPLQAGITMGLYPFELVLSAVLWCLMILTLQILAVGSKSKRLQALKPSGMTTLSMGILYAGNSLLQGITNIIGSENGSAFYLSMGMLPLKIVLGIWMYRFCRKSFEKGYDVR